VNSSDIIAEARAMWWSLRWLVLSLTAPLSAQPAFEADIAAGKYGKIVAVSVEQHGKPVYAKRFDSKSGPHDIRSTGKSITALAVGVAIADGKLIGVDAKVWPLLGAKPDDPRKDITVRDLLTMSSALDCDDGKKTSPGQEEKMYRTKSWRAFAMALPLAKDYKRDGNGFGRWSYCTAGVFLLGQVVEAATGERFDAFVQRRLLGPLDISDAEWRKSPSGEIQSGGQLRIGAESLAKLGRMVLDGGHWQGQQILPESWIKDMLQPHRQVGQYVHYGYLWWFWPYKTPSGPQGSWMMQGNGGNIVAIFRDYDAVIVVQAANYNKADADAQSVKIIEAALAILSAPYPAR
jgi:CubicO group peptidase (beta-lactamase class C family)